MTRAAAVDRALSAIQEIGEDVIGHVVVVEPAQIRLRAFETL